MNLEKYYNLVVISFSSDTDTRYKYIPDAQDFFHHEFPAVEDEEISEIKIQSRLIELLTDSDNKNITDLAQRCLLCFISWEIKECCKELTNNFGIKHGFSCKELLGYVLEDGGQPYTGNGYEPFAYQILKTFNPEKATLTTWTHKKVKQNPELKKFLLECGLYCVSDWAILNDTKPDKLKRIFSNYSQFSLTDTEINLYEQVLEIYHQIYRKERLIMKRTQSNSRCKEPTEDQKERMAQQLQEKTGQEFNTFTVTDYLENLSEMLRHHRTSGRLSFGQQIEQEILDSLIFSNDQDNEEKEFLELYEDYFKRSLADSLSQTIKKRVEKLQRKNNDISTQFLNALRYFCCDGLTMGEIAENLNMRGQDSVSRLLGLKPFWMDFEQEMLQTFSILVINIASEYSNRDDLRREVESVIKKEVSDLVKLQQTYIKTPRQNRTDQNTILNRLLCSSLDNYR